MSKKGEAASHVLFFLVLLDLAWSKRFRTAVSLNILRALGCSFLPG